MTERKEQFTPGPWRPLDNEDWSLDADGENTFQCVGPSDEEPVAIVAVDAAFGKDHILDANMALIAAAPELYEALLHAKANMPHPDQMIDDALAKARGEAA